jgi:hypothetical protein
MTKDIKKHQQKNVTKVTNDTKWKTQPKTLVQKYDQNNKEYQ